MSFPVVNSGGMPMAAAPVGLVDDRGAQYSSVPTRAVFSGFYKSGVTASGYGILVSLRDTTNFPHDSTGRLDISGVYMSIDRNNTATGSLRIGVITRVDANSADITYFQVASFENSLDQSVIRDRNYSTSRIKCGVVSGKTKCIVSALKESAVTGIKTTAPMDSPLGPASVTPGVGDIIINWTRTAGSYSFTASVTYQSEAVP